MQKIKYLFILIIVSCGNSKKQEIPEKLIQVWDQSKCTVCDDPWRSSSETIDDYTNLISIQNDYGDNSMTAKSYVLFKNVPLTYTKGNKKNASLMIPYKAFSKNCWNANWRSANLTLGTPSYWSQKNVEWIKKAQNGDLFDVLLYQPKFYQNNPKHACDYISFGIEPGNYNKIVVFPAGQIAIRKTGMYKFTGSQGDFNLIQKNNQDKSINIRDKKLDNSSEMNRVEVSSSNAKKYALINVDNLNFRSTPEISNNIIGKLNFEEKVVFIDTISIKSSTVNKVTLNKKTDVIYNGRKYTFNKHKAVEIEGPDGDYALVVKIDVGNEENISVSVPLSDIDLSNKKTWAKIKQGDKVGFVYYKFLDFMFD